VGFAVLLLLGTGHNVLVTLAIIAGAGCFWSWGVMHNYATEEAKKRSGYNGDFYDITAREASSVPSWITILNFFFTLAALGFFVTAIVI